MKKYINPFTDDYGFKGLFETAEIERITLRSYELTTCSSK